MLSAKKLLTLALVVPHVLLYAQTHALAFIEPKSNKKIHFTPQLFFTDMEYGLPYSIKGQCGIEIQIDFYERR